MDSNDAPYSELQSESKSVGNGACVVGFDRTQLTQLMQQLPILAEQLKPPHITACLRLRGELNRQALSATLARIVSRHSVLRTTFRTADGKRVKCISAADSGFPLIFQDAANATAVEDIRRREALDPFDSSSGRLIRARLLKVLEHEYVLVITLPTIIFDSWSIGMLLRELTDIYRALAVGRIDTLPSLDSLYAEYLSRRQQQRTAEMLAAQLEFWRNQLSDAPRLLQFPTDRPRKPNHYYRVNRVELRISAALTQRLREFSQQGGATLFATLLMGLAVLLRRWSEQDDVVIGTRMVNRSAGTEYLFGRFENIAALRIRPQDVLTGGQLLSQVMTTVSKASAHLDATFYGVVETLKAARGEDPLFQVMLELEGNHPQTTDRTESQVPGLTIREISIEAGKTEPQAELSILLREREDGLVGILEYASELFERETAERMAATWKMLLESIVTYVHQPIAKLPMLPTEERELVLYAFNRSAAAETPDRLIHELFEEQVRRKPDEPAVVYEDQYLTYAGLNAKSNRLARYLRERGVSPDRLVAVCMDRSAEMLVAMLGVLKAGGAYLPLDPAYPAERLAYMLKDAAPRIVLTQEHLRNIIPQNQEAVVLEREFSVIAEYDHTNLSTASVGITAGHLAYVIYTSGSTGTPKGAMNEHRGTVNRIVSQRSIEKFSVGDVVCQKTSISFVDAVFETFGALCSGRLLVIIPAAAVIDTGEMAALIARQRVTHLTTVPSLARSMLENVKVMRDLVGLRCWTLSGEEVRPELLMNLQHQLPTCEFIVLYGASEVSSDATYHRGRVFEGERVPIGRPVENVQVYILDEEGEPVPIGVAGDVYVGGVGVGRGYIKRPELTAERFVADPFSALSGTRLYKTGDVGRWRASGTLEYLGRKDHQVKVRGVRIELGEIEAQLLRQGEVREAIVVAREDVRGERGLVAYVVFRGRPVGSGYALLSPGNTLNRIPKVNYATSAIGSVPSSIELLREYLKGVLPASMVPVAFVVMEALPRTPNGKLDRRALPAPALDAYRTRGYEAPHGEYERKLAKIWEEVLRMEGVSRWDNFFELGGNSLQIMRLIEGLRRECLTADVQTVYTSPTLAHLARVLTVKTVAQIEIPPNRIPAACEEITPHMLTLVDLEAEQIEEIVRTVPGGAANVQDIYPLSPLQEGMLFHHLFDPQIGDTYVETTLLSVSSRERLQEIVAALQTVIDRHDILRTAVLWERLPQPLQVVHRRVKLPVDEIALKADHHPAYQIDRWIRREAPRIDLTQAPLMRLEIAFDADSGYWYVWVHSHHIVSDQVTAEVIISEVRALLEGRVRQLSASVPYREHVAHALAYARTHDTESLFRAKLQGIDEPTAPFGLLDVRGNGNLIEATRQVLGTDLARRVRLEARRLNVSVATLFHAAWALVVAHTSGRDDVVFGTVLLGRLHATAGVLRTVGMFINTLPLRLRLEDLVAQQLVELTQHELTELLSHEQASLFVAQRCSGIVGSSPLFSALLNYRHGLPEPSSEWVNISGVRFLGSHDRTNYPITLSVDDDGVEFTLSAQTDCRIDPYRITSYLHTALHSLVGALQEAAETPALALSILSEREQRLLLQQFNATQTLYPREKLIHELVEEQAERTPDAVAVAHGERALTYKELNGKANQLARYLSNSDVGPDGVVGICAGRNLEMVVGLLAILKAGGAYLPLDPSYPTARLQLMLEDAAPRVVLTGDGLSALPPDTQAKVIVLEGKLAELAGYGEGNLVTRDIGLTAQNLVYVIYTSGSTGQPKGVAMAHRSMVNLVEWHRKSVNSGIGRRVLQFAALSFDVAFQEIFTTLCSGDTLVLLDEWIRRDVGALTKFLSNGLIDTLFITPLMLQRLAEYCQIENPIGWSLQDVITAGEQLRITPQITQLFERLQGSRLHNHYGPTETHVVTSLTMVGDATRWETLPTIGRPIGNSQIYILDDRRLPVPIGVSGEICIGGTAVARGYLGRPELTVERFVNDPFGDQPGTRLYCSGDRGRWRDDGTLEYLGRNDRQVKIRGFRIEVEEIEVQLASHAQVKEAVVLVREDVPNEKCLVAYVVPAHPIGTEPGPSAEELRAHLRRGLPEHMLPRVFVKLKSIPVTPSGKLDRRALPQPEFCSDDVREYEAPRGEVEEILTKIWQEVLQIKRIGRQDDFFELGGHSLLAMQVTIRLRSLLSVEVPIKMLFDLPTVEQMSARIAGIRRERLLDNISRCGNDLDDLLERVASMPDSEVRDLTRELESGGQP